MAKPKVFVSSTYYDLKHIRSSLENFIESLGYEPVLSERGGITYSPDVPLDESCYREARNADIFVLIIGGRYGSETSATQKNPNRDFFEQYESVTRQEYANAVSADIPIYIFIERAVYSEYQTFLKNKTSKKTKYAHVDSVNVYLFIEDILSQKKNNPVCPFDRYADIEVWLKEQWAGLFRDFLLKRSDQKQIGALSAEVEKLGEVNETLKRYLEKVLSKVVPDESAEVIRKETEHLEEAEQVRQFVQNDFVEYLRKILLIELPFVLDAMKKATSMNDFCARIGKIPDRRASGYQLEKVLLDSKEAQRDFNKAREILSLPQLTIDGHTSVKPQDL